jgi:hypothetical protein
MNQYLFKRDCKELNPFPHIIEFASKKNSVIQFDSFKKHVSEFLCFYYVIDGRFDWMIDDRHYILYPGDLAVILPGQKFGGKKDLLDIGTVLWMHLSLKQLDRSGRISMGKWSRLSTDECRTIGRILLQNNCPVLSEVKEVGDLFQSLQSEVINQEIGYITSVNQLLDRLFILTVRQLTHQNNSREIFLKHL